MTGLIGFVCQCTPPHLGSKPLASTRTPVTGLVRGVADVSERALEARSCLLLLQLSLAHGAMASKFAGLEGVVSDQPEVFQTADETRPEGPVPEEAEEGAAEAVKVRPTRWPLLPGTQSPAACCATWLARPSSGQPTCTVLSVHHFQLLRCCSDAASGLVWLPHLTRATPSNNDPPPSPSLSHRPCTSPPPPRCSRRRSTIGAWTSRRRTPASALRACLSGSRPKMGATLLARSMKLYADRCQSLDPLAQPRARRWMTRSARVACACREREALGRGC